MAHMNGIFQIESLGKLGEIVRVASISLPLHG
jgi:hypothetical protein